MRTEDIINKVEKIIYTGGSIVFVIQTKDENDFWWWQVSKQDVKNYFQNRKNNYGVLNTTSETLGKNLAEQFANDPDNSDLGCSCSGYDTIDEITKEFLEY